MPQVTPSLKLRRMQYAFAEVSVHTIDANFTKRLNYICAACAFLARLAVKSWFSFEL
jgi:hypothetical protein